jgi:hypothetical protein
MRTARLSALLLTLILAACGTDAPLASRAPAETPPASPAPLDAPNVPRFNQVPVVAGIICVGTVAPARLDCGVPITFPGASRSVTVNAQGPLIRLERQTVAYDAARAEFSFSMRAVNLARRSAIGSFDGVTRDPRGINLVLVASPVVTGGTGSVRLPDAKIGSLAPHLPRNTPYYRYDEMVAPGGSTQWQRWRFAVDRTVKTFMFQVAVYTETQARVRITEVMPGQLDATGKLLAGGYFEIANVGEFDINDDVPGGGLWTLQDSAYNGRVAGARFRVNGPWKPGQRRLVAEGRYATWLKVPLDGSFPSGYWPAVQYGHAFKVTSGTGILLDRLTMAIPRDRVNGYSFQKVNLLNPNHTIPDIWEWIPARTRITCKTQPCPRLSGTPRADGV